MAVRPETASTPWLRVTAPKAFSHCARLLVAGPSLEPQVLVSPFAPGGPQDTQISGTVGPVRIGMDVVLESGHVISGHYFYVSQLKDIPVREEKGADPRSRHPPIEIGTQQREFGPEQRPPVLDEP